MAEGKKSFLLYTDLIQSIAHLTNEEKGILFNHLLEYVNDMNPVLTDRLLITAWKPIELSLKRDLEKFNKALEEKSISGRLGNLKRWHKDLFDLVINQSMTLEAAELIAKGRKVSHTDENNRTPSQEVANIADSVNDNVSVSDSVNDILLRKETKGNAKPKFPFKKSLLDLGVDEIVVDTFLEVRKKKKLTNSEIAFNKIKNEITKSGLMPNEALTIACEKSWGGFEAEWLKEKNFAAKKEKPTMRSTNEAFDEAKQFILNGGVINQ